MKGFEEIKVKIPDDVTFEEKEEPKTKEMSEADFEAMKRFKNQLPKCSYKLSNDKILLIFESGAVVGFEIKERWANYIREGK